MTKILDRWVRVAVAIAAIMYGIWAVESGVTTFQGRALCGFCLLFLLLVAYLPDPPDESYVDGFASRKGR
jgi:hypothetical protein